MFINKSHRAAMQRHGLRLAIAGALALAAALSSHHWLAANAANAAGPSATLRSVLVTARPLEAGTVIATDDLRWHPWPAAAIDPGWLVRGSFGSNPLIGRVTTARLAAGTPVSADMAIDPATGSAFAASIRPGRRAITIAVTPAAGLAGFVAPGDSVDVLLTQAIGNRRTGQTLLAAVTVLGIDQRQRGDPGATAPLEAAGDVVSDAIGSSGAAPPDLVTLEVTPRQAEHLAIAADLGKLSLILRGPGAESAPRHGRSWDSDVTGLPAALLAAGDTSPAPAPMAIATAPAATAPPSPRTDGVQVVYGLPSAPGPAR